MISKDRVLTALSHREPDRVPMDFGGTTATGIQVTAYDALKRFLGIQTPSLVVNRRAQLVEVEEAVKVRLHADIDGFGLNPPGNPPGPPAPQTGGSADEWGVRWLAGPQGEHVATDPPLAGMETAAEVEACNVWPDPADPARYAGLRERVQDLRARSGRAIAFNLGCQIASQARNMRGYEQWLMDFILNPGLAEAIMRKILSINLITAERALAAIGDLVDVVTVADDLATQNGPMMSPAVYRRIIKPMQQELFGFIRARTGAKLFYHCCGAAGFFLEDLLEAGIDILNPVQVSATNMEPEMLKKRYGDRVTFWGGVDTQHLLPYGSPQEVADGVKRLIDVMAPGGGFILATVHNVRPEVPPENLAALFDTALAYGAS
ncbi:MAG: uroporphyrinogen decarboxylase family protein [Thermodesulfobacteriota bacterium]